MIPKVFKAVPAEKCRKQKEYEEKIGETLVFSPICIQRAADDSEFVVVSSLYVKISGAAEVPEISKKDIPYGDQYDADRYMVEHGGIKSFKMA